MPLSARSIGYCSEFQLKKLSAYDRVLIFHILSYLYTNELTFSEHEDYHYINDEHRLDKAHVDRILRPQASVQNNSAEWNYQHLPVVGDWDTGIDATSLEDELLNVKNAPSSKISPPLGIGVSNIPDSQGDKGTPQQPKRIKNTQRPRLHRRYRQ